MKIAFIGAGNMGEAMLSAILAKKLSAPQTVAVGEADESRRQFVAQKHGVAVTADNRQAVAGADVVVLAIKPQNLPKVLADFSGRLTPGQLVLSIIAGARLETLCSGLSHRQVVRSMPNTPAQIGEGMTVWTATPEVTPQQRRQAGAILAALGKELYVDDEKYLDMATAISGSGPAYFFLFVESLTEAVVSIGLPRDAAEKLVLQTMIGSAGLIQKSGKSPGELRRMVTSPGGTTAAAIAEFEKGGLGKLVIQAVVAAHNRARELGKKG